MMVQGISPVLIWAINVAYSKFKETLDLLLQFSFRIFLNQ